MNLKPTLLSITLIATSLLSTTLPAAPKWYESTTIDYLYVGQVGNRISIKISTPLTLGSCTQQELVLDQSNPYFDQIFALLTSVRIARNEVSVYTDGTCASTGGLSLTDVRL